MYKTDLEIAQENKMNPILDIAKKVNLDEDDIEVYGKYKAKIDLSIFEKVKNNNDAKVILVTAINPTPAGEGKSTTTIGLADALNKLNKKTIVALREPSFGPVLGLKGGAAGGGYAQVVPMEDINLHFTGDMHAITCANNAISAVIDNVLHQGNELNIDPENVVWHRALDMNDRALRTVTVGQGSVKLNGPERVDHFDITVASEIMAILCLAKDFEDLKIRLARTVVAYDYDKKPITVDDLKITGALALILRDAIKPNLVQTLEHTPAIVHGGPFANIAHGCNSVIATKLATKLADYVVTEAGFGADLGAEKFLDLKCRSAKIKPSAVVVVATIRALKMHGGVEKENLSIENVQALLNGVENLEKHVENIKKYQLPFVVCINKFTSDTDAEVKALKKWAINKGYPIALSDVWAKGGEGGIELANEVLNQIEANPNPNFTYIYNDEETLETKIEKVCKEIYGADGVIYSDKAKSKLAFYSQFGWDKLPVCMAKTQYSLSDNPKLLGRPRGFNITIKDVKPSIGAGFIVCLTGTIMTMPGLPKEPAANNMDVIDGKAIGLF